MGAQEDNRAAWPLLGGTARAGDTATYQDVANSVNRECYAKLTAHRAGPHALDRIETRACATAFLTSRRWSSARNSASRVTTSFGGTAWTPRRLAASAIIDGPSSGTWCGSTPMTTGPHPTFDPARLSGFWGFSILSTLKEESLWTSAGPRWP